MTKKRVYDKTNKRLQNNYQMTYCEQEPGATVIMTLNDLNFDQTRRKQLSFR